jgi:pyruvate dehydrogenase E1 component alpha subunit
MLEIRIAEEEIQKLFLQNLIRGTTHLCVGQEACSVGMAHAMQKGDTVTCTYRGHGHALALGMTVKSMMAEMMGKESGACKGKGGSMHMTDASIGLLGANAIVGAQLPIAVGAALTYQVKGLPHVAVSFFGEGATNIGAFHESLNMAAIWKLPVVFVCENNGYGMSTSTARSTAVAHVAERALAYAMPGHTVNGNDFSAVAEVATEAIARARRGEGPSLIETKTYRHRGHSKSDRNRYRTKEEIEEWKALRDPINLFESELKQFGIMDDAAIATLREAVEAEIAAGIAFAKESPAPGADEVLNFVYTEQQ